MSSIPSEAELKGSESREVKAASRETDPSPGDTLVKVTQTIQNSSADIVTGPITLTGNAKGEAQFDLECSFADM